MKCPETPKKLDVNILFRISLKLLLNDYQENPAIYSDFFQKYPLKVLNEISKRKFSHKFSE